MIYIVKESGLVLLQAVPNKINIEELKTYIKEKASLNFDFYEF